MLGPFDAVVELETDYNHGVFFAAPDKTALLPYHLYKHLKFHRKNASE